MNTNYLKNRVLMKDPALLQRQEYSLDQNSYLLLKRTQYAKFNVEKKKVILVPL